MSVRFFCDWFPHLHLRLSHSSEPIFSVSCCSLRRQYRLRFPPVQQTPNSNLDSDHTSSGFSRPAVQGTTTPKRIPRFWFSEIAHKHMTARESGEERRMKVTLVVFTTIDPASNGPANALLAMSGWQPGPSFQGIRSHVNGAVRLLQLDQSIVVEDDLDRRWEEVTNGGEVVENVIFLSKHTAVSNRPALTVHPIGVPHLKEGDVPPQGGRPGWAAPPDPRMGDWIRLLKKIAASHNLIPEFEITMEATHHGPVTSKPTMFLEIGSTMEYWKREDAAQVIALLVWQGLGLGEGSPIGEWSGEKNGKKVLLGIGGGHYVPRHMDIIWKDNIWVGHLISGYSLPMEDPGSSKPSNAQDIRGSWKQSIKVAYEATKSAFPGGEIMAHLDQKSFKSWQKNAIMGFLKEHNIKIGKPNDFS